MEMTFEKIRALATLMEDADVDRDSAFEKYKKMYHLEYDLPDEVAQLRWVRKVTAHDPHDAIAAGKRVLSSIFPSIKYQPLLPNKLNRDRANLIEKNLAWQLRSANNRRKAKIEEDLVESALLYGACAAMVIDLDWHIKQMKAQGRDTKRVERARRQGRFLVNVYDPQCVHVRKGQFGTEAVLLKVKRSASDVLTEWGDTEDGEISMMAMANEELYYYDFMDYDYRCVWVEPVGRASTQRTTVHPYMSGAAHGGEIVILQPTEHKLDFQPWVAVMGGSDLEEDPVHQHQPMLYALMQSNAWETLNIAESLAFSDVIAKAANPSIIEEGPNPQQAQIDYTDASKHMKMPAGNSAKAAPPNPLDPGKSELIDRQRQAIEKTTVSSLLQGGNLPSNVAFAALNLATQTAVGALKPAKYLAEKALAEIFKKMLLWVALTGNELEGYISEQAEEEYGKRLTLDANEIEEETIYIEVELTPDVASDRQQRANTAALLIQSAGYPKEMALEDVGVTDPEYAMNLSHKEQLFEHRLSLLMQEQQAELDAKVARLQGMVQLELQQMGQEMMQAMAQPEQQGPPPGEMAGLMGGAPAGPMGGDAGALGGFGNAPNMGGFPPAAANPEGITPQEVGGLDRGGQPVQDLEGMITGQGEGIAG